MESKIISNMILQEGDSLGLSGASYAKTWGGLGEWRLSTEHVIVQPLHLYLFPPSMKVLATIGWLLLFTLSCDSLKFYIML